MSVPVSVPFADDYLESGTYPGLTELIAHPSNGFLYGCYEGSSPAANGRIVKIDQLTFSQITVANLPKPNPIDMHYDPGTDRFYIIYRDDSLTLHPITRVEPLTLAMNQFTSIEATLGPGSITGDGIKLYVVSFFDEPSYIFPITLSTGAQGSAMPVTGFTKINCLRFFGTKLYAESLTEGGESMTVLRISTAGVVEEASEPIQITGGAFPVDDMGDSSADIWIGNKDTTGLIRKFSKTALTILVEIATGQSSRCTCVKKVGGFIWAAFENGRAIRVDPTSGDKRNYTLSQGRGYHSEFTGDNNFVFTYNATTGAISRYHIITPSDATNVWQGAGAGLDASYAVALDRSGNIILTGVFQGSIRISNGNSISSSPNPFGSFIAKLSSGGNHLWSRPYQYVTIKTMALDASDNIIIGGTFRGTVNLGGLDLVAAPNSQDCFLAKFDSVGNHTWSTKLSGGGTDDLVSLAIDSTGSIIVTGSKGVSFTGFDVYGTNGVIVNIPGGGGGLDTYLAKFTAGGIVSFAKSFTNFGDDFGLRVAIDNDNKIWLAGATSQLINVGGGSHGGGYLVQMDSDGNYLQDRQVGDNSLMASMARDAAGDILICGTFIGQIDLGGGNITGGLDQFNQPAVSAYLVKYSRINLSWQWNTVIRGSSNGGQFLNARLFSDSNNNIWMSGYSQGNFIFDTTAMPGVAAFGHRDGFLAKFSNTGSVQRVTQFAGTGTDADVQPNSIVVDTTGIPILSGSFTTTVNFAATRLISAGNSDVFVGKFP